MLMMWNHRSDVKTDNGSDKEDKMGQNIENNPKLTLNGIQIQ